MFRKKFIDRLREKYQKGGQRTTIDPKTFQFLRRNNLIAPAPDGGTIKPEDTSIRNKMFQAAMRATNFTLGPDAPAGLPSQFIMESTGIPSFLRLPTSASEAYKDPSAKNVFNAALDVAGVAGAGSIIKSAISPATTVAQSTSPVVNTLRTTGNVLDKAKKVKLVQKHDQFRTKTPVPVNTPVNKVNLANLIKKSPVAVSETTAAPIVNVNVDKYKIDPNQAKPDLSSFFPTSMQTGGMYNQMIQYQQGGIALPGGEMQPIPGTDAVEFIGQSHDEGGIMVDPQTEVEGGETMDQVTMAKHGGKRKDYFFSSYLKRGGRSFADIHKDILKKGGNQKDIDMLAKMQEKAAGRNPKKVAKLGGIAKYQAGGSTDLQGNLRNINLSNYDIIDDGSSVNVGNVDATIDPSDLNTDTQSAINFLQRFQSNRLTLDELREKYPDYPYQDIFSLELHHKEVLDGNVNADGSPTEQGKERAEEIKALEEKNKKEEEEKEKKDNKEKKNKPVYTSPFATKEEEKAFQDWANTQGYDTKGYGWGPASQAIYDQYSGDYETYVSNLEKAEEKLAETDPTKIDNDKDGVFADVDLDDNDPNIGAKEESEDEKRKREQKERRDARRPSDDVKYQTIYDNLHQRILDGRELDADAQAAYDEAVNYLGEDRMTTKERKAEADRIAAEQQQFDEYRKAALAQSATPELAKIAGVAQLAPAVYAMTYKQPAAEQAVYTPGFTEPIVAERGKASDLERVNYNAERAANAAEMRGINRFIETSGGGPANIINKMSAYARKQAGDMKITAAETRANIDIANREAQLEQQMELSNLQRAQQAATINAHMQRQETARMDQIGVLNAQARQKLKDDQEAMKYQGIGLAAQGIAGIAGDVMSYRGQERLAKAYGNQGIYERDLLRNYLRQTDPKFKDMSDPDLNAYITQYNTNP